jgi:hypothetical protein
MARKDVTVTDLKVLPTPNVCHKVIRQWTSRQCQRMAKIVVCKSGSKHSVTKQLPTELSKGFMPVTK